MAGVLTDGVLDALESVEVRNVLVDVAVTTLLSVFQRLELVVDKTSDRLEDEPRTDEREDFVEKLAIVRLLTVPLVLRTDEVPVLPEALVDREGLKIDEELVDTDEPVVTKEPVGVDTVPVKEPVLEEILCAESELV